MLWGGKTTVVSSDKKLTETNQQAVIGIPIGDQTRAGAVPLLGTSSDYYKEESHRYRHRGATTVAVDYP